MRSHAVRSVAPGRKPSPRPAQPHCAHCPPIAPLAVPLAGKWQPNAPSPSLSFTSLPLFVSHLRSSQEKPEYGAVRCLERVITFTSLSLRCSYNCSTSLSITVVSPLLCLMYKSNFIMGMCGNKHRTHRAQHYLWLRLAPRSPEMYLL